MKLLRLLILGFAAYFLIGCSAKVFVVEPELEIIDLPPRGEVTTRELGETLVVKYQKYTTNGLIVDSTVQANGGFGRTITIDKGSKWAHVEERQYGSGIKQNIFAKRKERTGRIIQLIVDRDVTSGDGSPILVMSGQSGWFLEDGLNFHRGDVNNENFPNFRQVLIYNGRVGNYVKFLYREYKHNLSRPAFTQEIQYDITESNEIGFKGVRLIIVEATNREISYKVIKPFADIIEDIEKYDTLDQF